LSHSKKNNIELIIVAVSQKLFLVRQFCLLRSGATAPSAPSVTPLPSLTAYAAYLVVPRIILHMFVMAALCNKAGHYIFLGGFFLLLASSSSSVFLA